MNKLLTASAATLALAGVTLGAAAPAEARYHGGYYGYGGYHHYHHGGGRTALALSAGILGLAAGAAIADNHRGYGSGYRSNYSYGYSSGPSYYDEGPSYYAPPPPNYYNGPVCRTDWRWDGYARRYARVEYCD